MNCFSKKVALILFLHYRTDPNYALLACFLENMFQYNTSLLLLNTAYFLPGLGWACLAN